MLEALVVGAGIAGCSAALALRQRGALVTLVEMGRPGSGATGASAGMVAPQYEASGPTPLVRSLLLGRLHYPVFLDELERLAGESARHRRDGMLVANFSEEEHDRAEQSLVWQAELGLRAELWDVERAVRRQPEVGRGAVSYLWLPDEAQVDTQQLPELHWQAALAAGVRLLAGARVAELSVAAGRVRGVVLADGRRLEADAVVLAAGAWSDGIQGLPRRLPVRPVRGQILRFPAGSIDLGVLLADAHGRYLVPRDDGSVLAGSTMEEVGFDCSLTESGAEAVRASAVRLAPRLHGCEPQEHWAGLRPLTADGLPIIGEEPELGGLFYSTGFGRSGIVLGPLAGELVAELAVTGRSDEALDAFRPDRFPA